MLRPSIMLRQRQYRYGLLFTAPAVASFLLFWLAPLVLTVFYSFADWRVGSSPHWAGLGNYGELFDDPLFRQATIASLQIALYATVPSLTLALLLAIALADPRVRFGRLLRVLFMVPVVTDWVATGLVWQLIFLPNQGVLASLGSTLGIDALIQMPWTSSETLAPIAISIFIIWKTTSLYTIFFFAALKALPLDVVEAATTDGANPWQLFWKIKWPLMRPITLFVVVLSFITTLALFEPVFMLTGGGPANATRTLPIFLYENFFSFGKSGYASAAGVIFLLLALSFALVASKMMKDDTA